MHYEEGLARCELRPVGAPGPGIQGRIDKDSSENYLPPFLPHKS